MTTDPGSARSGAARDVILLGLGLVASVAIRLALLPAEGLRGDIDQFVGWVSHIANNGLSRAFDAGLTFGPVIAYVWGLLGAIEPAFRTASDATDVWLRMLMKLPSTLADVGLAAGVAYGLRARPRLAVIGALALLLHPATWYVSAWWGQWESMYALSALFAALLAIAGRDGPAAVFLAAAVLTKPQALPLLVPFAAWFLARGGALGLARATLFGTAAAFVIWLPFLEAGGPLAYLRGIGELQDGTFSVLSLRAWNAWWPVQLLAGGEFVRDDVPIAGGFTLRTVGYLITGSLALVVAHGVWRDPRPRTLVLGLAGITLVAFTFLTTMHERYAYAAVVFLMLLIDDVRVGLIGVAFGLVFALNLVAAAPATPELAAWLPVWGPLGVVGSVAMIAVTFATLREQRRGPGVPEVAIEARAATAARRPQAGSS